MDRRAGELSHHEATGGFQNVSDVSLGLGKASGIRRSQEDGVLPEMRLIDPDRTDSR